MVSEATRRLVRERLAAEVGRIDKDAPRRLALCYPSPYAVAMSSLGFQRIYRAVQEQPGMACERVFLPDGGDRAGASIERPVSYESLSELGQFPLLAFSVAYEIEIGGLVRMLDASGIAAFAEERDEAPSCVALVPVIWRAGRSRFRIRCPSDPTWTR